MKLNLRTKRTKTKATQGSKRCKFAIKPLKALTANGRAINAVISNIILIAAVIAVGFAVLVWSQYQSANYQMQYSNDVNANIAKVQEKVVFEYVVNVGGQLKVYLLNCGMQNVTIQDVYVTINDVDQHFTGVNLLQFGGSPWTDNVLPVDEQGYFTASVSGSGTCVVKVVTGRGSTFVGSS